jgi:hypothetical protein
MERWANNVEKKDEVSCFPQLQNNFLEMKSLLNKTPAVEV